MLYNRLVVQNELAVCVISTVPYDDVKLCCALLYDHVGREGCITKLCDHVI